MKALKDLIIDGLIRLLTYTNSSPSNGDFWYDGTDICFRSGGVTYKIGAGGTFQPLDSNLTTLAGLTPTTNNFITSVGGAWASRTPSQVKTTLSISNTDVSGLGTLATQNGTFSGTSSGTNTGDQIISDATLSTSDITTNNFSTAKHGFVPKGTNIGYFLKDDGTWAAVTGGSATSTVTVAQTSHGFSVGDIIRQTSTVNVYAKAKADTAANAEVIGFVTTVTDANNFVYTLPGLITSAGIPSGTTGDVYFLSASTAGAMTTTDPAIAGAAGTVSKPILSLIESGTIGYFHNFRGVVKSSSQVTNVVESTASFDFGNETGSVVSTISSSVLTEANFKSFSYIPIAMSTTYLDDFYLNNLCFNIENIVDNDSFDIRAVAHNNASGTYYIKYRIIYIS